MRKFCGSFLPSTAHADVRCRPHEGFFCSASRRTVELGFRHTFDSGPLNIVAPHDKSPPIPKLRCILRGIPQLDIERGGEGIRRAW